MKKKVNFTSTECFKNILLCAYILITIGFLCSCSQAQSQPFESRESSISRAAEVKNCRITAENLDVKSGAGENFHTIAILNKGDEVHVLSKIDNWYVIRMDNYRVGCIDSSQTTPIVRNNSQPQEPFQTEQPGNTTPDTKTEKAEATPAKDHGLNAQSSRLFELINQERRKNDLEPLRTDPKATQAAGIKAQDMIDNDYFSHNSPTYGSPFDMLDEFDVDYQYSGENIAQNQSAEQAHKALMNSSGHRRNILNPDFTHVGIGIRAKENRGYIYVEMFTGIPQ